MSTRTSILYTDREHWWTDCIPEVIDGVVLEDVLTINISKKSILRVEQDEDGVSIDIDPRSEIYKVIMSSDLQKRTLS